MKAPDPDAVNRLLQLQQALRRAGGNRTVAAGFLGVSRRTMQYKLKEHFPDGI